MDASLVMAAEVYLDAEVHFLCKTEDGKEMPDLREFCNNPPHWTRIPSRWEMKVSHDDYVAWYEGMLDEYITQHGIDIILPCSTIDIMMSAIGNMNAKHGLPGLTPEHAAVFSNKAVYFEKLKAAGVAIPTMYEVVPPSGEPTHYDWEYPCLAKPARGSGGYGVYVAMHESNLRWFFGPSDRPNDFTERALFYQDLHSDGTPKAYLHFGMGGEYLVQEYIDGPCVSLAGVAFDGKLELDLAYDITVTSPPNCSEIEFGWPSRHPDIDAAAERLRSQLEQAIDFPNGAWMADSIYRDGQLHLVDLSCRMSSSGTAMLSYVTGQDNYPMRVMEALTGEPPLRMAAKRNATSYKFVPFPKGRIESVSFPERSKHPKIVEAVDMVSGGNGRIHEMRNDGQVSDRGWVVGVSDTRDDAEAAVDAYLDEITYEMA